MYEKTEAYLLALYETSTSATAKIRDRIFSTVRNICLAMFSISGFLIAEVTTPLSIHQKVTATIAIITLSMISVFLILQWYRSLYSLFKIRISAEVAMGFHQPDLYIAGQPLLPADVAAPEALIGGTYDNGSKRAYLISVIASSLLTISVILLF